MRSLDQLEPRTPIATLPFTITQPGSYVLVRSLSGAAGGITVSASNVTIDLNGFTLSGDRFVFGHGLIVVPSDNVAVQNGVIQQWGGDGIHAPGVTDLQLRNVRVLRCAGAGVEAGSATLRDVAVADNDGAGIRVGTGMGAGKVSLQDFHFVRSTGNGGGGITYVGPCDASLTDSGVAHNTGHGVAWASTAPDQEGRLRLERCVVEHNTGRGLHIEEAAPVSVACATRGTSFRNNGSDGIAVLLAHPDAALRLDLREGVSSHNGGNGLTVREGVREDNRNVIVDFSFDRNILAGAAKIDGSFSPGLMSRVTARNNGGPGLALQGGAWTIEGGSVSDNGADGLQVTAGNCCRGHVIIMKLYESEFVRNAGSGVTVDPGAIDVTYQLVARRLDASGNTGRGLSLTGAGHLVAEVSSISSNGSHGVAWKKNPSSSGFRVAFDRCEVSGNAGSGLHLSEADPVEVTCDFSDTTFHRNGESGVTLLLSHPDALLDIVHRGGGASGNAGHGLHLAAGRAANQGFFDIALSRNGGSGCNKFDAGPAPGTMERVVAQHNGLHGLDLTGGTWSLSRCVASDNTGSGFVLASTHVRTGHVTLMKIDDCEAARNGADGLRAATADTDADYKLVCATSHFRSNGGNGLHLSCDHASSSVALDWRDSSASGNADNGVKLIAPVAMDKGLRFRVAGGDCSDNANDGFVIDDTVTVSASILSALTLSENGACGFRSPSGPLRFSRCVATDNGADGFRVAKSPLSSVTDWGGVDCDDTDARRNGGSGLVLAGFDASSTTSVSIRGGTFRGNTAHGIDIETSPGARGLIHGVHLDGNGVHGLVSSSSSLAVTGSRACGNVASGLHIVSGAHVVSENVITDNAVGVVLAVPGSSVVRNTFSGTGGAGMPQVPVDDASGASDVAPLQDASGASPLGNQIF